MITTQFTDTAPMMQAILAQQQLAICVDLPLIIDRGDFCWCSRVCPSSQLVFAGGSDKESDQSSFIFAVLSEADTVVMELWKAGAKVADLDDNALGTYYSGTNESGQLYYGYLLDWSEVYTAHGGGQYQVKTTATILSQEFEYESDYYDLMVFNQEAADQTVRIETYQNGYTESAMLNFTGMNWYSQIRLSGTFRNRQPEFVTSNYKDSIRQIQQIQDQIVDTWELELPDLSDDQKDRVVYEGMLANRIIITDYSLDNNDRYRPTEVYPDGITSLDYKGDTPGASLVLKFRSKKENILKRNVYF